MAYESKVYYINKAKREAMTFCQQMISFFQQQLKERTNIIEEKKQIIHQYEQKLEKHSCSISSAKGHASATKKNLAVLHQELEHQKEKTTATIQDAQTS